MANDMDEINLPKLVTSKQAADYLQVEEHTLAVWRCEGRNGIPYIKVGGRVRYRTSDLREFVERNLQACA